MEARGKYDFMARAAGELNFKKNDVVKVWKEARQNVSPSFPKKFSWQKSISVSYQILSTSDKWYKAEMNGHEGLVPRNYVDLTIPGWFQENATRGMAEQILSAKPVGDFVIRGCQSSPGNFSISVKHECNVQHFKVIRDERGHYILWAEKFTSLNKLVNYYKTTSISKTSNMFLNDGVTTSSAQSPRGRGQEERIESIVQSERRLNTAARAPDSASLHQVLALYDFNAEEDDELSFCAGDIINITDTSNSAWWTGRCGDRKGLFPANYTKPI